MPVLPIALIALLTTALCACSAPRAVTVATYNAWGAGANESRPIDETIAVLRALEADVIAMQEVRAESPDCGVLDCAAAGPDLAGVLGAAIGYFVYSQPSANDALWANAILSRYPIRKILPHGLGVIVGHPDGDIAVVNVHLPDSPYQPYQLTGIPYGDAPMLADESEAIAAADAARGHWVELVIDTVSGLPDLPLVVVCGDFNEPSHLDWTEAAARLGVHPMAVRYPAGRKLADAGFIDAYRHFRPDEIRHPGFTWTPKTAGDNAREHHDRIDFVFLKGSDLRIRTASVVGESPDNADVVVVPWPSDHRAVRVTAEY